MMTTEVSVSVLSANPLEFGQEIKRIEKSGAEMIHYDVMDGIFVNNITFGMPLLKSIKGKTKCILDVHLMIQEPLKYVDDFADAGADIITFHIESGSDAAETIAAIRRKGVKAAVSIKPNTPADAVLPYLDKVDMVLVMTVEPGFGGQSFMPDMMPKLKEIREECKARNLDVNLQVDGGIAEKTVGVVAQNGANVLVAGSAVFGSDDPKATISMFRDSAKLNFY